MQEKNLIFLTMVRMADIRRRGIYTDLLRKFQSEGWNIYVVTPHERSMGLPTELKEDGGVHFLGVKTLNLQKTNAIEKGVGQVLVESQFTSAIKKYLSDVKFDLVLYSTPPITFPKVIAYLKRQNPQALTYLLLKDIFPQNAVDLGMMRKTGVKGVLYRFFRRKEKKLYALSDYIGCMSPANVEYVLRHNPEVSPAKVEVAPNSVEAPCPPKGEKSNDEECSPSRGSGGIREKYGLPTDKPIFIYGGNLGKPQGIPFLMECLEANAKRTDCHFVVIGTGTEMPRLKAWYDNLNANLNANANENSKPSTVNGKLNITVMKGLPKAEYDELVRACDVGLIFLDHRFTIPNFPSRLLSYLENRMPVLCATDPNTDMGRIAEENDFGYWCESNSVEAFTAVLDKMIAADRQTMGEKGYEYLKTNYTVENTYGAIISHFGEHEAHE